ncbi:TlpA disulfide reductase family protein [Ferrimonas gelatinilytica]|uniref:TlpA disulfide reductase family protein n=1 Tax=Ferrimonas gelatinilytica TaxID=1255257 RepID=A0ABP9SC71_9GAMM
MSSLRHAMILALALLTASVSAYPGAVSGGDDPALARFVHLSKPQNLDNIAFVGPDGKPFELEAFRGHPVMINLWATWCPPCVRELPSLMRFRQEFEAKGLKVAPVSIDRDTTKVAPFLEELGMGEMKTWFDTSNQFGQILPTDLIPATFILDEHGQLVAFVRSFVDWDSPAVRQAMTRYLPEGQ